MNYDDFLAAEKGKAYTKCIGIDTGVNTGIAIWNKAKKKFDLVSKVMIHQALEIVADQARRDHVCVFVEDARLRNGTMTLAKAEISYRELDPLSETVRSGRTF